MELCGSIGVQTENLTIAVHRRLIKNLYESVYVIMILITYAQKPPFTLCILLGKIQLTWHANS